MKARLSDIAKALQMDISTVSRGLRGDSRVTQKTRLIIMEAAERMGYTPNLTARALASGKTGIIWFILPGLHTRIEQEPALYASKALAEHDYDLYVIPHHDKKEVYERLLVKLGQGVADGAIIIPGERFDLPIERLLVKQRFPLVYVDRYVPELDIPVVTSDNRNAVMELTHRSIASGIRSAIIGFENDNVVARERKAVAEAILKKNQIPYKDVYKGENVQALEAPTGFFFSSQYHFNEYIRLHGNVRIKDAVIAVFDSWIGSIQPYRKVIVAVQDFKEMAEVATSRILSLVGKQKQPLSFTKIPCSEFIELD